MAPTDMLENEHRLIERAVRVLAIAAENLKCGQHLPAELLRSWSSCRDALRIINSHLKPFSGRRITKEWEPYTS